MDEKTLLTDLAEIIAIPSVYSAPTPDAPYGEDCRRALEWFVDKARAYGLNAANVDNRCAYAEYGDGGECIGILAHLDVVPAGNGWDSDPFGMIEREGWVIAYAVRFQGRRARRRGLRHKRRGVPKRSARPLGA